MAEEREANEELGMDAPREDMPSSVPGADITTGGPAMDDPERTRLEEEERARAQGGSNEGI